MAKYCTLHPKVNVDGELQHSKLFGQIKDYTMDYQSAVKIYYSLKNNGKEALGDKNITYNDQGEFDLKESIDAFDLRDYMPVNFIDKVKKRYNLEDEVYSMEEYQKLLSRCNEFNNSIHGTRYFASIDFKDNMMTVNIKYRLKKGMYNDMQKDISDAVKIHDRLFNILRSWDIAPDVLTDAESRALGDVTGVTDFTSSQKAADGFYHIIRVSKGLGGDFKLPEEFGHVIVRALESTDIMKRLLKLVKDNGLAKEILGDNYDKYNDFYSGNEDLLAEEAVGKLMAIHVLQNIGIDNSEIYSRLLGRTVKNAKDFFSKFDETEISDMMNEINQSTMNIATKALDNDIPVNIGSIRTENILANIDNVDDRIKRFEKIITRIKNNELKRIEIHKNDKDIKENTRALIKDIDYYSSNAEYATAILQYVTEANKQLKITLNKINEMNQMDKYVIQNRAQFLRHYRDNLYSYLNILKQIQNDIQNKNMQFNEAMTDVIPGIINDCMSIISSCLSKYNQYAKLLVRDYWAPIIGESFAVDNGWFKKNVTTYTIDQLIDMDITDISWFDTWLDSAAQSRNYLIKGLDKVVREKKNSSRLRAMDFFKEISVMTRRLEQSGIKNQDFMFEEFPDGHKTGYYISEFNRGLYERDRKKQEEHLKEVYKDNAKMFYKEMDAWDEQHPISKYTNKKFQALKNDSIKYQYYKDVMAMKRKLDLLLPMNRVDPVATIKIRKDLLQRVKSSHSMNDALHAFTESVKEGFVRNSTETEFGIKSTLTTFEEDQEYKTLPIFYTTKSDDTSEDDISTDIVSTMTAFAAMAYEFDEMSSIVDVLETTRDVVRDAPNPISTTGGKLEIEPIGQKYKRKQTSNILERMNSFFDMQIYHKMRKDEGTIGESNIATSKVTDRLMEWSRMTTIAFNALTDMSNVATGKTQMRVEAIGGQFFKYKDLLAADRMYFKNIDGLIKDIGNKTKSSWFWTVSEAFDIMDEGDTTLKNSDFYRSFYERWDINTLSTLGQHAGEIYMHHRTFFALANSDKEMLTDKNGNRIKVIDSFTVEPIDKDNPRFGSRLVFKKGLTDTKGNKIITKDELKKRAEKHNEHAADKVVYTDKSLLKDGEISEMEFINYFKNKAGELNRYMHGIYNEQDRAAMYSTSLGKLIGQFRKWIKPSLNRRFGATQQNLNLDTTTEGYYRTVARVLGQYYRDIKAKQFNIMTRWNEMDDYEKANLKKANAELATYALLSLLILLIKNVGDDDDEWKKSYAGRMFIYQCYRLKNEVGALIPWKSMVTEGTKIINSPMAGVNLLERVSGAMDVLTFWNWREIKSGRYKGWYSPFSQFAEIVPYNRAIYGSLHPEERVKYFLH